jgi:hypothetical protein
VAIALAADSIGSAEVLPNRGIDASALVRNDDGAALGRDRKRIPDLGFQIRENAPSVPRAEHDHTVWW